VTRGRPRGVEHALELDAGDDVGVEPVAVLLEDGGVKGGEASGDHDGAGGDLQHLLLLVERHRVRRAHLLADATLVLGELEADLGVDDVLEGHGLGELDVDRLAVGHALVELGGDLDRALLGAGAAGNAPFLVHVPRVLEHPHGKVARIALDRHHLRVGEQVDVGVARNLHQLGREDAHGAVVGREGLVQTGHHSTDAGLALHQVHRYSRVRQVEGGLDPSYASPDDHHSALHGTCSSCNLDSTGDLRLVPRETGMARRGYWDKNVSWRGGWTGGFRASCGPRDGHTSRNH
jgi:hypothetical protein